MAAKAGDKMPSTRTKYRKVDKAKIKPYDKKKKWGKNSPSPRFYGVPTYES